jgi:hypothetical protein
MEREARGFEPGADRRADHVHRFGERDVLAVDGQPIDPDRWDRRFEAGGPSAVEAKRRRARLEEPAGDPIDEAAGFFDQRAQPIVRGHRHTDPLSAQVRDGGVHGYGRSCRGAGVVVGFRSSRDGSGTSAVGAGRRSFRGGSAEPAGAAVRSVRAVETGTSSGTALRGVATAPSPRPGGRGSSVTTLRGVDAVPSVRAGGASSAAALRGVATAPSVRPSGGAASRRPRCAPATARYRRSRSCAASPLLVALLERFGLLIGAHVERERRVRILRALVHRLDLTPARVTRLLALLALAPDLQERVLFLESVDGLEPLTERALRRATRTRSWEAQRAIYRSLLLPSSGNPRQGIAPPAASVSLAR